MSEKLKPQTEEYVAQPYGAAAEAVEKRKRAEEVFLKVGEATAKLSGIHIDDSEFNRLRAEESARANSYWKEKLQNQDLSDKEREEAIENAERTGQEELNQRAVYDPAARQELIDANGGPVGMTQEQVDAAKARAESIKVR